MENMNLIKNLPKECRPYEKCMESGAGALSSAELLAVIIRTGAKGIPSVSLAANILKLCGDSGISGICRLSFEELTQISGIGTVKALQILCIAELSRRIAMSERGKRRIFSSAEAVAEYYMEDMRHKEKEELHVVMLDAKSAFLGDSMVSVGTVNAAVASPREIFLEALKFKAVGIILLHNHPSGDPTPSHNDITCTRKIREAGELIGITLVDHIIIGDKKFISLNEKSLL